MTLVTGCFVRAVRTFFLVVVAVDGQDEARVVTG
jgi:hypothetical protein